MDAAGTLHASKGYFEAAGEFPGVTPVDFPVSVDAQRHKRFGPSFLHRYLPFWAATFIERDVNARTGTLPIEQWLANLDRIERAAEHLKTPTSFASEAYTLREHIPGRARCCSR